MARLDDILTGLRDIDRGAGGATLSLLSAIPAQIIGGVGGMAELARTGGDMGMAADKVRELEDRYTYVPRSERGRQGLQNIGHAFEWAKEKALAAPGGKQAQAGWEKLTTASPLAAALLVGTANVLEPRGLRSAERASEIARSAERAAVMGRNAELPGMERSAAQMREQSRQDLAEAKRLSMDAPVVGTERGQTIYGVERAPAERTHVNVFPLVRDVGEQSTSGYTGRVRDAGNSSRDPGPLYVTSMADERLRQQPGLREPVREALDTAEATQRLREEDTRLERAAAYESRGQPTVPQPDPRGLGTREYADALKERLIQLRSRPIIDQTTGTVYHAPTASTPTWRTRAGSVLPQTVSAGHPAAFREQLDTLRDLQHARREAADVENFVTDYPTPRERAAGESAARRAAERAGTPEQLTDFLLGRESERTPAWARRLTEPPSGGVEHAGEAWWKQKLGLERDPAAMNREALDAFLTEAQNNPNAFVYGAAPDLSRMSSLEDVAGHFGRKSGKRIEVEWGGESDEPYKVKREKEHGRGEVMRDRYGEYKYQEHEPGEKLREQDTGEIKKKTLEEELVGPPREGEFLRAFDTPGGVPMLMGEKRVPKRAEGGEMKFDEEGNPVLRKSEGGEPVRDERGHQKYTEEENPDYSGDSSELVIGGRGGKLKVTDYGGREMHVDAQESSPGAGTDRLYQTLLADAVRGGHKIASNSLTSDNQLRVLSNALSNYARFGENPRDVTNTRAGKAPLAKGFAEGPELWRAEAGEARARMSDETADRVAFDGEHITVDGKPVESKQLLDALGWTKDDIERTNVGQKTVMRMALFDWLKNLTPAQAKEAARDWGRLGPIFSGVGGAAVGLELLKQQEKENVQ